MIKNIEKKFDEWWISKNMMDYSTTRAAAKFKLNFIKKNQPNMYKLMLDNYFDEVHPY